jgi:hypothetical protein
MSDDYPLYDGTPPHEEPETSEEAAHQAARFAKTQRERVQQFVSLQGEHGAIDDEIELGLGMRHQTASARRRELVLLGALVPLGIKRRTRSGARAMVHVLPEFGPPPEPETNGHQSAPPSEPPRPLEQGGLFD